MSRDHRIDRPDATAIKTLGVDASSTWNNKKPHVGEFYFPEYKMRAYCDGETFIPLNGYLGIADASEDTIPVSLVPGGNTSIAITSPGHYLASTDVDVTIKATNASGEVVANLPSLSGAYSTTPASLATKTGLDFETANFCFETFFNLTTSVTGGSKLFTFGHSSGPQIAVQLAQVLNLVNMSAGISMIGDSGGVIKPTLGPIDMPTALIGSQYQYHLVCNVTRGGNSGTGTVTWYINGSQVAQGTWTEAATVAPLNLNNAVNASSRLMIGGTGLGVALWDGYVQDLKFYKTNLTLGEITARNQAGPLRSLTTPLDVADLTMSWAINFKNSNAWANPLYPECISEKGNAVFNTVIGTASIAEKVAGTTANINDLDILAGHPMLINLPTSYLSVMNKTLGEGLLKLTPVAV